ncbi:MAG: hypothetical protein Q7K54_02180 [Candidatus Parcubacteria bacterium]|nr:hypothetical protein [Candidatus Parcubacteria bacterium]
MTKKIIEKNIKLSLEFDKYLNNNPDLYIKIPNGASIFITVKGDSKFNEVNRESISSTQGKIIEARKTDGHWTVSRFMPA